MVARRIWHKAWLPLALAALAVVVIVLVPPLLETSVFPDPPGRYATFRDGNVSVRHPPGWTSTRDGSRVTIAPPGERTEVSPMIVLRWSARQQIGELGDDLVAGSRVGGGNYEMDIPGAGEQMSGDVVFKTREGTTHRVSSLVVPNGGGGVIALDVRGRVTDDDRDVARIVMGSFRLDG